MMTTGRHVPAKEAHALGIFDELAAEGKLDEAAIAYAKKLVAEKKPIKRVRDLTDKIEAARKNPDLIANFRKANARKLRNMKAPRKHHQMRRGGDRAAVRRGAEARDRAVAGTAWRSAGAGHAPQLLRRA